MEVLQPTELAAELGIHRATLFRWIEAGKFPPPRDIGLKGGWIREDLEWWLRTRPSKRAGAREGTVGVNR